MLMLKCVDSFDDVPFHMNRAESIPKRCANKLLRTAPRIIEFLLSFNRFNPIQQQRAAIHKQLKREPQRKMDYGEKKT